MWFATACCICDVLPLPPQSHSAQHDPRGFTAKVSDFGLSDLFTPDGPFMGELGGTVTHIAPEIVTHKRVTPHADVYAFGIIMWELYTGECGGGGGYVLGWVELGWVECLRLPDAASPDDGMWRWPRGPRS